MTQAMRAIAEVPSVGTVAMKLLDVRIISGSNIVNHATVILEMEGERCVFCGEGNGPIDALCNALHDVAPDMVVSFYNVKSVGKGSDAEAKADVTIEQGGQSFSGAAFDTNTDVAGVRAIIEAMNLMRYHECKRKK